MLEFHAQKGPHFGIPAQKGPPYMCSKLYIYLGGCICTKCTLRGYGPEYLYIVIVYEKQYGIEFETK